MIWTKGRYIAVGVILVGVVSLAMGIIKKIKKVSEVSLKKALCPDCGAEQPRVRKPKNWRQALWGGHTCSSCGCEMDRFGKKIR